MPYSRITFTLVLGYDVVIHVLGSTVCVMLPLNRPEGLGKALYIG